jgi:hypothetical protein
MMMKIPIITRGIFEPKPSQEAPGGAEGAEYSRKRSFSPLKVALV